MVETVNTSTISPDDLPVTDSADLDLPVQALEVTPRVHKAVANRELAGAAIIQNHIDGSDMMENFEALKAEVDPHGVLFTKTAQKVDADIEDINDQFVSDPGITPEQMGANASLVNQMTQEVAFSATDTSRHVVESASGLGVDLEVQQVLKGQMDMLKVVQKLNEDLTIWDKVSDFVTMIIPTNTLEANKNVSNTFFSGEDFVRDLYAAFHASSAEEQAEMFPVIKEHLLDSLTETEAVATLTKLLDPAGEEQFGERGTGWAILDAIDTATLGMAMIGNVARAYKATNAVRLLSKLDRTEDAAKVNAAAMMDETGSVADELGIADVTAYNNTAPFDMSKLDDAYAAGLSTETLSNIRQVQKHQEKAFTDIAQDRLVAREEMLSAPARDKAEVDFVETFTKDGFENIKVTSRTADDTTFQYSLVMDGETLTDQATMTLKLSDTRAFENTTTTILPKAIISPLSFFKGDVKDLARSAIRQSNLSPVVSDQLAKLNLEAISPIVGKRGLGSLNPTKRRELQEVDDVLVVGDEFVNADGTTGKVFTNIELKAGVDGKPLNNAQIETYWNVRTLNDGIQYLNNIATRRKMLAQNKRQFVFDKQQMAGRLYDDAPAAQGALNLSSATKIYDATSHKVVNVSKLNMAKLYDEGKVLTTLDQPMKLGKLGGEYDLVIAGKHSVQELPDIVVHSKAGYIAKYNQDTRFFIKEVDNTIVNGARKTGVIGKTRHAFNNRKEADEFLLEMQNREPTLNFQVLEDREIEKQLFGGTDSSVGGGMYYGARSNIPIPFGKKGAKIERKGAFESIAMNLSSVERSMTRSQWRMGMEEQWIKTAQEMGIKVGNAPVVKFQPDLMPSTADGRYLKGLGEQIQEWSGFPTKGEQLWKAKVDQTYDWALGLRPASEAGKKAQKTAATGIDFLQHTNPIAIARSAAFHSLLGWFNPAQVFVQAQGVSTSLAIATTSSDMLGAINVLRKQTGLGIASTTSKSGGSLEGAAKAAGMATDEMVDTLRIWDRTGYEDSLLNTADHAAALKGYGIGRDALSRAANAGLVFYRFGESINRRTAFLVALDELKVAKGVDKIGKIPDSELRGVMDRANNLMLNLSKANAAGFQKGLTSTGTQFMQVQTKMLESMVGSDGAFTAAERVKISIGQLALYGTAGVPFADWAARYAMEMYGTNITDMSKIQVDAINGGIVQSLFSLVGADVDAADRGAIHSAFEQTIEDLVFGETTAPEVFLGASGQFVERTWTAFKSVSPIVKANLALGFEDQSALSIIDSLGNITGEFAKITSTWTNVDRALYMNQYGKILDAKKNEITGEGEVEFNATTLFLQAAGFQHEIKRNVRDLEEFNKDVTEYNGKIAVSVMDSWIDFADATRGLDIDSPEYSTLSKKYGNLTRILMNGALNEGEKAKILNTIKTKLSGDSRRTKIIKSHIERFSREMTSQISHSFTARAITPTLQE